MSNRTDAIEECMRAFAQGVVDGYHGGKRGKLSGKIVRKNAEVIMLFKVDGKYYPATEDNAQVFEAYLHTGEELYLQELTNEMEAPNV